jgi:hypothetical protein
MIDLPAAFKTTVPAIPAQTPYLAADPDRAARWKSRMPDDGRLNVGLAWSGQINSMHRHMSLADLAPLAHVPGVRYFSLQKGDAARQPRPAGLQLTDWTDELNDYADTAVLMANLDLVISIDTGVAHLAGAMGKCLWVMLKSVPDWRWMMNRPDSPWYPTARLFRQTRAGDWTAPVSEAAGELTRLACNPFHNSQFKIADSLLQYSHGSGIRPNNGCGDGRVHARRTAAAGGAGGETEHQREPVPAQREGDGGDQGHYL